MLLDAHPDVGLVGGAYFAIDAAGRRRATVRPPTDDAALRARLSRYNLFAHPAVTFRREAFEQAGGYRLAEAEDYDLWLRISERWQLASLAEPVLEYRHHPGQVSLVRARDQALATLAVRIAAERRRAGADDPLDGVRQRDARAPWSASVSPPATSPVRSRRSTCAGRRRSTSSETEPGRHSCWPLPPGRAPRSRHGRFGPVTRSAGRRSLPRRPAPPGCRAGRARARDRPRRRRRRSSPRRSAASGRGRREVDPHRLAVRLRVRPAPDPRARRPRRRSRRLPAGLRRPEPRGDLAGARRPRARGPRSSLRSARVPRTLDPRRIARFVRAHRAAAAAIARIARAEDAAAIYTISEAVLAGGLAARRLKLPSATHVIGMSIRSPRLLARPYISLLAHLSTRFVACSTAAATMLTENGVDPAAIDLVHNAIPLAAVEDSAQLALAAHDRRAEDRNGRRLRPAQGTGSLRHGGRARGRAPPRCPVLRRRRSPRLAARERGVRVGGQELDRPPWVSPTRSSRLASSPHPSCTRGCVRWTSSSLRRGPRPSRTRCSRRWRARVPIVATAVEGNLDAIVDGESGLLVEPTPEAIAAGIDSLLADPVRAAALGEAAHARVAARFDERVTIPLLAETIAGLGSIGPR